MARQIGGLIDDGVADTALRQDRARALAASAGIEIVAVEIEHHDAGALDALQQGIEPRRVEPPAVIEIVEAAIGGRRGRDDPIDIARAVRRHQRQKGAEGLPGKDDLLVAVVLELGGVLDEALCAVAQRVALTHPVEPHDVPAIVAQSCQISRGGGFRIFGVDRAPMAPDDNSLGLGRPDRRPVKGRIETHRKDRSRGPHPHRHNSGPEHPRHKLPHPRVTPLLVALGSALSLTKSIGLCHFVNDAQSCVSCAAKWRKRSRLRSLCVCGYLAQTDYAMSAKTIRVEGSSRRARRA